MANPKYYYDSEADDLDFEVDNHYSPLAELTTQEHRGKGNDTILHDKQKETEIDRGEFAKESNIGKVVLKMLKRIGVI